MTSKIKEKYNPLKNKLLFHKYKIGKILGKGSFGCVLQGVNIKTKELVAIKLEDKNADSKLLQIEAYILYSLKGFGIPKLISFGKIPKYTVMIQEILGFNLMQIKHMIYRFTKKDIAMLGIQMMDRIEFIHSKYIIHRDIKPENFTTGFEDISTIYLIDFGISRKYRSSKTLKHVKFSLTGRMFGTIRYASYNASRGVEQTRRDDLEAIAHMLIYIYSGKLPWKGISLKDREGRKKYLEMLLLKKYTPPETVCKEMPEEFIDYYKYVKSLNFEQDPDYEYLRNVFRRILKNSLELNDYKFSWLLNKNYLKNLKTNNQNINIKNIKNQKYVNILLRSNSPGNRLYRSIKKSLEKDKFNNNYSKNLGFSEDVIAFNNDNKNNINNNLLTNSIDIASFKTYNRGISEDAVKTDIKLDINKKKKNSNKSKEDSSYKSDLSQFNMNVDEFQDETKIYEQNKTIINMIKNSKDEIINFNVFQSNNINSENKSNYNKFKINEILKDFKMNEENKYKLNLSMDLGFNYNKSNEEKIKENNINKINKKDDNKDQNKIINLNENKEDDRDRPKSQNIKNNLNKKINLTNKESEIKKNQEELYNYIFNNIINNLIEKRLENYVKMQNQNSYYIKKHAGIISEKNNYNEIISQNFSFKNLNIRKNLENQIPKEINVRNQQNKNNAIKKNLTTNTSQNRSKISKAINNTKINNNIIMKKNINNNNIKRKILNNDNNLADEHKINIIINTNVNSYGKISSENNNNRDIRNNIINKKQINAPIKKSSPFQDIDKRGKAIMNNQIKNANIKNKILIKENRNNNFMKNSSKQNNIILIPKQSKFLMNNSKNKRFRNNQISNNINKFLDKKQFPKSNVQNKIMSNNIKYLTNISKINNNQNQIQKNIRTFEYKSVIKKRNNSPSPQKFINNRNSLLLNQENIKIINLRNLGLKQLTKNNSYDSIINRKNIKNVSKNKSLSDLNQNINGISYLDLKQRSNKNLLNNKNKIRIKHYSPQNNNSKNKYSNLLEPNRIFFDKLNHQRTNSDTKNKRVLNFNNINLSDNENTQSSLHRPMNLNNLNIDIFNSTETKCFNFIRI